MSLLRLMSVFTVLVSLASSSWGRAPVPKDAAANRPTPEVQVIGVYEGTVPPGIQRAAGVHPPGSVTVKVGDVKKPIILVLMSYEPVLWYVEAPKGAVVQVIASGYHQQAVAGLDKQVPVTLLSHEAGDKDYFYAYRQQGKANSQYDRAANRIKALTKQEIKGFQGEYTGSTFEIR